MPNSALRAARAPFSSALSAGFFVGYSAMFTNMMFGKYDKAIHYANITQSNVVRSMYGAREKIVARFAPGAGPAQLRRQAKPQLEYSVLKAREARLYMLRAPQI